MFTFLSPIYYEAPEAGSGQGPVGETSVQGEPQGAAQPQQATAPGGDFWGMFPSVPEEHRPLLEPHLREQVLPYVTRLEQQVAPFRPFIEQGVQPGDVGGLINFAQAYEQDPMGTWLRMAEQLHGQGILHEDLDLQALAAIARGEDLPDDQPVGPPQGVDPQIGQVLQPIMEQLQQMSQQVNNLSQWQQTQEQQTQQQRQEQALQEAYSSMRGALKDIPESVLTDDYLKAHLVAAQGNQQKAVELIQSARNELLKGFTGGRQQQQERRTGPTTPNGPPPTRQSRSKRGGSRDGFEVAHEKAQQYLERNARA